VRFKLFFCELHKKGDQLKRVEARYSEVHISIIRAFDGTNRMCFVTFPLFQSHMSIKGDHGHSSQPAV